MFTLNIKAQIVTHLYRFQDKKSLDKIYGTKWGAIGNMLRNTLGTIKFKISTALPHYILQKKKNKLGPEIVAEISLVAKNFLCLYLCSLSFFNLG
jgi:hypothetical protein